MRSSHHLKWKGTRLSSIGNVRDIVNTAKKLGLRRRWLWSCRIGLRFVWFISSTCGNADMRKNYISPFKLSWKLRKKQGKIDD